jgi:hypothetical protein
MKGWLNQRAKTVLFRLAVLLAADDHWLVFSVDPAILHANNSTHVKFDQGRQRLIKAWVMEWSRCSWRSGQLTFRQQAIRHWRENHVDIYWWYASR